MFTLSPCPDQRLSLAFAHAHGREIPQTGIAAPVPASFPLLQLALADKARRRRGDVSHLAAGRHRLVEGGKPTGRSLASAAAIENGPPQLGRHLLIGLAQRP